ncbi:hypothetical protein SANTM175S_06946 [Streptomyces antimycoticus]
MRRRVSAAAVALLLGGAGVLLGAGSAAGAEVSYKTECLPPPISGMPPVEGTTTVAVTAPATAKVGEEVEVVWKTVQAASKNPPILDLEANTILPTGTITVGGAQTGDGDPSRSPTSPAPTSRARAASRRSPPGADGQGPRYDHHLHPVQGPWRLARTGHHRPARRHHRR